MYNRAPRFKKLVTPTPPKVGPATYLLSDIFDQNVKCQCGYGSPAPFNTTAYRDTSVAVKNLLENPSANKYKICFRKQRIVGGTSLQNISPRFKYRVQKSECGGEHSFPKEAKILPGKVCHGVPPRNNDTKVSTIPEKGAEGYIITNDGLVKIYNPPENRPVGPLTYYNPEGNENYTTMQYKGNFWSLRTAERFKYKRTEGPGPAEYTIDKENESPWKKYLEQLQAMNVGNAPSLRFGDVMLRRLCIEDLPGPGAYSPFDPNTQKCECGKDGTFGKAQRDVRFGSSEGPGPAAYSDNRSAIEKANKIISHKKTCFNVNAQRFPPSKSASLPGPSDYDPQVSLWIDVKKKEHSRYSQWSAPFDSSAYRNTSFTKPDVLCIPGPDIYNPQFQKKGDQNKSSMFASKTARPPSERGQNIPGPGAYSDIEAFKNISNKKSHLQPHESAFLVSSVRMKPLQSSKSPGPGSHEVGKSSLSRKGGVIGKKYLEAKQFITPSPLHYTVHPKYEKQTISILSTHNVTLGKQLKTKANKKKKFLGQKEKKQEQIKKLRCFFNPYPTRHCSINY